MVTKFTINKLLTVLFAFSVVFSANAQDDKEKTKHLPSIMLGVSGLKYMGYIGSHTNINPLLDARLGYFLSIEQRFGKILGVELVGTYGKLAGTDNQTTTSNGVITQYYSNFQADIMQGQLMLTANFDGVMKGDPMVSPFIKAGIGYMMFNTYSDLQNGSNPYIYQADGSIVTVQTVTVSGTPTTSLVPTKRDYTYETKLPANGQTGALVIPMMIGLDFNFGKHMSTMFGVGYTMCLSNWIDGTGKGSAGYFNANIGLRYEFGKKSEGGSSSDQYKNVDFSSVDHLDADKDGVPDDKDMCHGTPKGVKVDEKGCPLDGDNDGVPDYLDKEPTTAKGNKVDGYGVTIDEAAIAQHQKDWQNEAPERSKEFNVKPSAEYLKQVEAKAKKVNQGKASSKIPADLKSADINNDGFISADEITKTIDSFFEGNGDFTVEKINKLIDFFFEQ